MQIQTLCGGRRLGNKMLANVILHFYILYKCALIYYTFYIITQIHILYLLYCTYYISCILKTLDQTLRAT